MKTLVLGGVKSGKSRFAESMASDSGLPVTYVATATPGDEEMQHRIAHHRANRPSHWHLIEEPLALGQQIESLDASRQCVLIDCLTLWLSNCLTNEPAMPFTREREALVRAVAQHSGRLILVSNETNLGITPMGALSRRFTDEAGLLHQELASLCDVVVMTMAGLPLYLKGKAVPSSR